MVFLSHSLQFGVMRFMQPIELQVWEVWNRSKSFVVHTAVSTKKLDGVVDF